MCEDGVCTGNIMVCRSDGWKYGNTKDQQNYWNNIWLGKCDESAEGTIKICETGGCIDTIMTCRSDGWDYAEDKEILTYYLGSCDASNSGEFKMCDNDYCPNNLMICRADGWDYANTKEILSYYVGTCDLDNLNAMLECTGACAQKVYCTNQFAICREDGWGCSTNSELLNYYLGTSCNSDNVGELKQCETGTCKNNIMVCRADGWDNANTKEKLSYYLGTCATDNVGELKMCEADYCKDRIMVCRADGWDNANTKEKLSYYLGTCATDNVGELKMCEADYCKDRIMVCRVDGWDNANTKEILSYYVGTCDESNANELKMCDTGVCVDKVMVCREDGWDYGNYKEQQNYWNNYWYGTCDQERLDDIIKYSYHYKQICTDEMWNCQYMICTETGWESCYGEYYYTCQELLLGTCDNVGEYKCIDNWGLYVCKHSGWREIDVEEQAYWNYFLGECKTEIYDKIQCIESNMFGCAICSKDGNWYEVGQPDVLYYELGECYYNGEVKFCENGSCPLISTHYNYTSNYFKCDCRNPLDDSIYYHTSCDYIQTYEEADILINKLGRCDHDGAVTKCEDEYCEGKYYVCYYEGEDWPLFYWYETTQEYEILKYILGECNQDGEVVQCEDEYCNGKNYRCTFDFDEYYWQEIND